MTKQEEQLWYAVTNHLHNLRQGILADLAGGRRPDLAEVLGALKIADVVVQRIVVTQEIQL